MRKITKESVDAFMNSRPYKKDNMVIEVKPDWFEGHNVTIMYLFGNIIAYKYNDPEKTISITDAGWQSRTTMERLNAIPGVRIHQKNWEWYLNGNKWDGKLTDI